MRTARLAHDEEFSERETLRRAVREAIALIWSLEDADCGAGKEWMLVGSYEAEDGNLRSSIFCGA